MQATTTQMMTVKISKAKTIKLTMTTIRVVVEVVIGVVVGVVVGEIV